MPEKGHKPAQEIVAFYCRPCTEYHYKDHPHYREMLLRKARRVKAEKRRQAKEADPTK